MRLRSELADRDGPLEEDYPAEDASARRFRRASLLFNGSLLLPLSQRLLLLLAMLQLRACFEAQPLPRPHQPSHRHKRACMLHQFSSRLSFRPTSLRLGAVRKTDTSGGGEALAPAAARPTTTPPLGPAALSVGGADTALRTDTDRRPVRLSS